MILRNKFMFLVKYSLNMVFSMNLILHLKCH